MATGFTYASGQSTYTLSAICPICGIKRYFTKAPKGALSYEELCCSPEHGKRHYKQVRAIELEARKKRGFKGISHKVRDMIRNRPSLSNGAVKFINGSL